MSLIVHISDLHFSKSDFNKDKFQEAVNEINALNPDFIILTGDLTDNGYYREFEKVTNYIAMFQPPLFIIPGNHDSRNLGYESFEELIGERSWKITVGDDLVVIGLDSSAPDLNSGNIGRPQQAWLDREAHMINISLDHGDWYEEGQESRQPEVDAANARADKAEAGQVQMIKNMLSKGKTKEDIIDLTGITEERYAALMKSN